MKSRKLFTPPDNLAVLLPYSKGGVVAQANEEESGFAGQNQNNAKVKVSVLYRKDIGKNAECA